MTPFIKTVGMNDLVTPYIILNVSCNTWETITMAKNNRHYYEVQFGRVSFETILRVCKGMNDCLCCKDLVGPFAAQDHKFPACEIRAQTDEWQRAGVLCEVCASRPDILPFVMRRVDEDLKLGGVRQSFTAPGVGTAQ